MAIPSVTAPPTPGRRRTVAALGIATIVAYGGWFYGFSVLIQPISDDTGWPVALLGGTYAAGQLAGGLGSTAGGALLDRLGGRITFAVGGIVGGALLAAASAARHPAVFAAAFAGGAAIVGALGFYHVTMAAARRAAPHDPSRAIAHLTVWGALASPIFLPLTAWLVEGFGWRGALATLGATTAAGMIVASVIAAGGRATVPGDGDDMGVVRAARTVWADPAARRLVVAVCAGGFGAGVVLTYQVPVMVALGLPLAVASTVAGARGLCQILGRIGLVRIVDRVGARRTLAAVLLLSGVGSGLLAGSATVGVAAVFAVVAGTSMGAASPLQGIYAADLLPERHLGALMGAVQTLGGAATAAGPLVGGVSTSALGSYTPAVLLAAATFATGGLVLLAGTRRP